VCENRHRYNFLYEEKTFHDVNLGSIYTGKTLPWGYGTTTLGPSIISDDPGVQLLNIMSSGDYPAIFSNTYIVIEAR
jgi:hypothetical protein